MMVATVEKIQERKQDRIDRGLELWRSRRDEIHRLPDGRWSVPGADGGDYLVDLETRYCNCRDKQFNAAVDEICKHGWAAIFEMYFHMARR